MREVWRLLPYDAGSTDLHFRLSDALVRLVSQPTVWWHSAASKTLLLGVRQAALFRKADPEEPLQVVQRHAGGTAVLATPAVLGLDIALPRRHPLALDDILESYRWLGETWVEALSRLGIEARTVSIAEARSSAPPPTELAEAVKAACFGTLSPWEVLSSGRKLVGLAQVRRQRGVLLQAGIHLSFDAAGLADLLAPERAAALEQELLRRAVGVDALAHGIGIEDVVATFNKTIQTRFGVELQPATWTKEEVSHAETLRLGTSTG